MVSVPKAMEWLDVPLLGRLKEHTGELDLSLFKHICSGGWMGGWLADGLQVGRPHETAIVLRMPLVSINGTVTWLLPPGQGKDLGRGCCARRICLVGSCVCKGPS